MSTTTSRRSAKHQPNLAPQRSQSRIRCQHDHHDGNVLQDNSVLLGHVADYATRIVAIALAHHTDDERQQAAHVVETLVVHRFQPAKVAMQIARPHGRQAVQQ